jgi:chloramphenicol 3-O phosphotransferase
VNDEAGRQLVTRILASKSAEDLCSFGLKARDAEVAHRELAPIRAAPKRRIVDVRRNGRRVDARVRSDNGASWLLVVWSRRTMLDDIESVTIFERPKSFRGRDSGLVIVLNGPSSVGKSSLMRAFAERASTPFACLEEPWFGRLPTRFLAWPETLGPHVEGVLAGLAASARLGNQFIISAAGIPQGQFEDALRAVATLYVGLEAPLDVLVRRQLSQNDKFGGLAEESVQVHQGWTYDLRIDTADTTPEEAAHQLAAYVESTTSMTP